MRLVAAVTSIFFLVGLAGEAMAQQQLFFSNLTEKDGLSNNSITCFFKDRTGFIWIGTESGLNRYSGNHWKIYKPSARTETFLSNSFITAINQDAKGDIWVATRKGLNRIIKAEGRTEYFLPKNDNNNSIPSDYIQDVLPDIDSTVWIAADAKDFCSYNTNTRKFVYYPFRKFIPVDSAELNQEYHSILKILPKNAKELWLVTTDGIFLFNKTTGNFSLLLKKNLRGLSFFYYDQKTKTVFCTGEEKNLFCIDLVENKISDVLPKKENYNQADIARSVFSGKFLLMPVNERLACINENKQILFYIEGSVGKENALLPGSITSIYSDGQGITWIGTKNGVSKFIPSFNRNLHVSPGYDISPREYSAVKNFIFNQNADEWWLTSWKKNIIFSVNNSTGEVRPISRPVSMSNDTCYAFYKVDPDTIYLLSNKSLLRVNSKTGQWDKIKLPTPISGKALVSMVIDRYGNFWLLDILGEIFMYNPGSRKVLRFPENETGNFNSCLVEDRKNNCIWIGSAAYGLFRYNFSDNKFRLINSVIGSNTSLNSYIINDLLPDGNGNLWVATFEGGLAKYNTRLPAEKGFTNFTVLQNMPDDNIYSLAPDGKGGVWYASIKGIGHLNNDGSKKELYNKQAGLPYSKFTQSIAALPDGNLAAVSDNNFIRFNPLENSAPYENVPVIIEELLINDTLLINTDTKGIRQEYSYDYKSFTFQFSVADFTSAGAAVYYYMLEGLDKDWVFAGQQSVVRYSKLDPGDYTFRVKAVRDNGGYYSRQAAFGFHLDAPYWQKTWFKLLVGLSIIGLVSFLIKRRIKFIRREATLKQKIAETEMMALRAQMNPHFIFNCLNAIDNLIQTNQKEKATTYLARFAKLIRNVLDSSKNNVVPFEKDFESLKLYLEMEQFRCSNKFGFELSADPELLNSDYKIPPLIVQPFAENAIHHGLLNKEAGEKKLLVEAKLKEDSILYTIIDNGIGREKAREIKERNKPGQKSDGIRITEERIRLYNRRDSTNDLVITDLCNTEGVAGTKVEIHLKQYDDK